MAQAFSHQPHCRGPGFNPVTVHVGFVVDKVTQRQFSLQVFWFSPVSTVPPVLHTPFRHYII
jgi:hypothetical protein